MNRTKGMVLAVVLILLAGIGITAYTKSMIGEPDTVITEMVVADEKAAEKEEIPESDPDGMEEAAEEEDVPAAGAGGPAARSGNIVEGVPRDKEKKEEERMSEAAEVVSPADEVIAGDTGGSGDTRAAGSGTEPVLAEGDTAQPPEPYQETKVSLEESAPGAQAEDFSSQSAEKSAALAEAVPSLSSVHEKRLSDLEAQADRLRIPDEAYNQYAIQNAAQNEWKLWDGELNRIYSLILKGLSREEAEALVKEERAWILSRDEEAAKAAADYGGSMESVEYRTALTKATKKRVYELYEAYGAYITE